MKMGAHRVRSYSLLAKCMHWAFIGVFAYAVINQVDEVEELENFTRLMKEVLFAIIFLSLLLFRFIYICVLHEQLCHSSICLKA